MELGDNGRRAFPLVSLRRIGLFVVVVLILEYAAVHLLVGARESWDSVSTAVPQLLLVALVLELCSFASFSGLTRTLVSEAARPRYATILGIDLTGNGFSRVVPGGGATAAALRFRLLGRVGVRLPEAVGVATLQSGITTIWLVGVFGVGLLLVPLQQAHPLIRSASALAAALLVAVGGLVAVLMARPDQVVAVTHAVGRRLPLLSGQGLEAVVRSLINQVQLLARDGRAGLRAFLWGLGFWSFDAACLYLCVRAFGDAPSVGSLLTTYALVVLLAFLPLTPGGLGIVEGVAVPVLVSFGTPQDVALLGVLSWRLFQFWLPIPIAMVSYLWLRLTVLGRQRTEG